jgi:Asp-tRNA(Asn)/Glu-tRNA(Gln) amidotransferase A subunit family amidase
MPAAPAVRRLREAGAILVGVTNCAEFALAPVDHNRRYGRTLNPRNIGLTPGGSSSGCAAAVAAGIVSLSVGTDYGGSVRYPAHCTGVLGLRPPRRLVPVSGQVPAPPVGSPRHRFSVPGLIADDMTILLVALEALIGIRVVPARPAVVAWASDDGSNACERSVSGVVEDAAAALGAVGPSGPGGNPLQGANDLFTRIRATDALEPIRTMAKGREDQLTEPMRRQLQPAVPAHDAALEQQLVAMKRRAAAFFRRYPVLIAPVATTSAPPAGADLPFEVLAPCRATSLLGVASISVPFGTDSGGNPIGVQLAGRLPEVMWAARELATRGQGANA